MKTFLIIGGESNLAKTFAKVFPDNCVLLSKNECDITSQASIEKIFRRYRQRYVLNCAAITDMELCERDPERCFMVNSIGPALLSFYCLKYRKKLIHISSNYAVLPVNTYGLSKFIAEKLIDRKNLILRTSFYSNKYYIVKNLLNNRRAKGYDDLYFNPISINRLALEIFRLKDRSGLINIFSKKKVSTYDFAINIAKVFNIDLKLIKKETYSQNALKRPANSYIKSDVPISLVSDLREFKRYLSK